MNDYRVYFGKSPTDEQTCYYLEISQETLERLKIAAEACKAGSMDKEIGGDRRFDFWGHNRGS